MNGIAAGHGCLAGIAGGLAQGFEGRGVSGRAILVRCQLTLERLDGFESRTLGGRTRVLNAKRESEPDNCPDSGDDNDGGDDELRGGAFLVLLGCEFRAGISLSRAAVRANGAGGINRALAVRAEIHSVD